MIYKVQPWAHQLEAIQRAVMLPHYALFFEMGAGKTMTVINILRHKYTFMGRLRTIIFCPPIVIPNWLNEWKVHSNIPSKEIIPLVGSGEKRLKTFLEHSVKGPCIFVTNYQSLQMKELYEAFEKWLPQALVFDESHKCKSPTTKTAKLADRLANPFEVKFNKSAKPLTYILSGSPILNSPMDIFQQFKVMDGGTAFGWNFWAFRARYFRDRNAGMPKDRYFPKWEIMTRAKDGLDALAEINEKIFSVGMRVEKKDCLDLPPEVSIVVPVEMSKEQKRLYDEMRKDFVTYYQSRACVASLAITKALRLMQITSGFVALESLDPESENPTLQIQLGETPKLQALEELLAEITEQGHKVLVWAVWRDNYEHIRKVFEKLKLQYVEVHGGISEKQKLLNVEKFQNDPDTKGFIGHPGSGGIGINLVNAAYSIFYSRTFSLEHYLQARARNHRGGSKEAGHVKITHYDLVCSGTIDELIVNALANKQAMSDKLLSDMAAQA